MELPKLGVLLELPLFFHIAFIIIIFKIPNDLHHEVVGSFELFCGFSQFLHEILLHRLFARLPLRAWHLLVRDLAIPFTRIVFLSGALKFLVNKSRSYVFARKEAPGNLPSGLHARAPPLVSKRVVHPHAGNSNG